MGDNIGPVQDGNGAPMTHNTNRERFTPAERAWLDEVKTRWQPLTEPQAAMVRRYFGPNPERTERGAA